MTNTKRWLDELPLGSRERELLLVGKAARPAEGAIDANWQALCTALGATAAISGTFATGAAANSAAAPVSASASVGTSLAAGKAASAGLFIVAAKSLVVGAGIGLALMGAASVVRPSSNSTLPATATKSQPKAAARQPLLNAVPVPHFAQPDPKPVVPAPSSPSSTSNASRMREPAVVGSPLANQPSAPQPTSAPSAMSAEEKTASLARQARELAELKRLIDHGSSSEALARMDEHFSANTPSTLSEERDALYVQALARSQRRTEADAFARQFLIRYPHSPYFETVRQLLTKQ